MPISVTSYDIDRLTQLIAQYPQLIHLKVSKRGNVLTLTSLDGDEVVPHTRMTLVDRNQWRLSFPRHTGGWETTPFVDTLDALFTMLLDQFPFTLHPFSQPPW